jgi:GAF domain-containing protein
LPSPASTGSFLTLGQREHGMYSQKFLDTCKRILAKGIKKFDLELAIISHIDRDIYTLIVVEDLNYIFKANSAFQLGDTYCREVVNRASSVAILMQNQPERLKSHPLYDIMPLEAYISSPILYNGKIWGTVNFSSTKERQAFTQDDVEFNERLARDLSASLCAEEPQTKFSSAL